MALRFAFTCPANPSLNHRCDIISGYLSDAAATLFDFDRAEVTGKRVRPALAPLPVEAGAGFGLYQLRFIDSDFAFP